MRDISEILYYLCKKYPYWNELTRDRVIYTLYLIDWRSAVELGRQLTPGVWYLDETGPLCDEVVQALDNPSKLIKTIEVRSPLGYLQTVYVPRWFRKVESLTKQEMNILNWSVNVSQQNVWLKFITYIYSTYPVFNASNGEHLDLITCAKEYKDRLIDED